MGYLANAAHKLRAGRRAPCAPPCEATVGRHRKGRDARTVSFMRLLCASNSSRRTVHGHCSGDVNTDFDRLAVTKCGCVLPLVSAPLACFGPKLGGSL